MKICCSYRSAVPPHQRTAIHILAKCIARLHNAFLQHRLTAGLCRYHTCEASYSNRTCEDLLFSPAVRLFCTAAAWHSRYTLSQAWLLWAGADSTCLCVKGNLHMCKRSSAVQISGCFAQQQHHRADLIFPRHACCGLVLTQHASVKKAICIYVNAEVQSSYKAVLHSSSMTEQI